MTKFQIFRWWDWKFRPMRAREVKLFHYLPIEPLAFFVLERPTKGTLSEVSRRFWNSPWEALLNGLRDLTTRTNLEYSQLGPMAVAVELTLRPFPPPFCLNTHTHVQPCGSHKRYSMPQRGIIHARVGHVVICWHDKNVHLRRRARWRPTMVLHRLLVQKCENSCSIQVFRTSGF